MDEVTLLVKRKQPKQPTPLLGRLGLASRDVPYVAIIVLCMAVSFMSGRMSALSGPAPLASAVVQAPAVAAPVTSSPPAVVPVQDLPEDIPPPPPPSDVSQTQAVQALALPVPVPVQSARLQPRPVPAPIRTAAVPPEKIELEDEPENPYRTKPHFGDPGF